MGDRPDIEVDGEVFESPFHAFMSQCMKEKNLTGLSQSEVQDELSRCSNAWEDAVATRGPSDVDEQELAERFLEGREGRPTGDT
jgi:hypothetical protein